MENNISPIQYVLAINTELQKKNDQNIQYFLNKYKHYEEIPELKTNTGKDYDAIISHRSTIPDLVIYNKVFNKNDCFVEANKKENNYFPRQCFYIKFDEKEKQQSKGENHLEQRKKYEDVKKNEEEDDEDYNSDENEENEQPKEKINIEPIKKDEDKKIENEEYSVDSDDEAEEEEEDENCEEEINIQDSKNENMSKINDFSEVENNTIYSNNNSMYKDLDFLPSNYNNEKKNNTMKIQELFNQSGFNFIDNSVKTEDMYNSFNSNIFRGIINLDESNNDGNSFLITPGNIRQNNDMNKINNSQNFPDTENNKIQKMFLEQNQIFHDLNQRNKQNNNNYVNEEKELKENIIRLYLFDPQGNIIEKSKNINEMFEYLTENFIEKDKKFDGYDIYNIDEDKSVDIKFFYMSIFNFLRKIKENISINIK